MVSSTDKRQVNTKALGAEEELCPLGDANGPHPSLAHTPQLGTLMAAVITLYMHTFNNLDEINQL